MRHDVAKNGNLISVTYLFKCSLANVHARRMCEQADPNGVHPKSPDNGRVIRAAIKVSRPEDGAR